MARLEVNGFVGVESDEVVLPRYVSWIGIFVGALSTLGLLREGTRISILHWLLGAAAEPDLDPVPPDIRSQDPEVGSQPPT